MKRGRRRAQCALAVLLAAFPLGVVPRSGSVLAASPLTTDNVGAALTDAQLARLPLDLHYPSPPLLGRAALLYDLDSHHTLLSYHAEDPLPIASTTKLMTALLTLEHGLLDTPATVSIAAATVGQSTMGLQQGEVVSRRQLLYGLLLPSGNDAAIALAESVGGSQAAFVAMMNARCKRLGCTHTHFTNPHGLDAIGHYASAHDLLRIARAVLRFATLRRIVRTRTYVVHATAHNNEHDLVNVNQPLWWYPGVEGLKSGTEDAAGHCEVLYVVHGGRHLLAVLLGMPDRVTDVRDLLNFGLRNYTWHPATQAGDLYLPDDLSQDTPARTLDGFDHRGRPQRYYPATGYYLRAPFLQYATAHPELAAPTSEATAHGQEVLQRFGKVVVIYRRGSARFSAILPTKLDDAATPSRGRARGVQYP